MRRIPQTEVDRVVETLYSAVLEPSQWETSLQAIASWFSAIGTLGLTSPDPNCQVLAATGWDPAMHTAEHARHEVLVPTGKAAKPGAITPSHVQCADEKFFKSTIYNEFYKPLGVARGVACVLRNHGPQSAGLFLIRSSQIGRFEEPEVALLQRITPHVQRAYDLTIRVAEATQVRSSMEILAEHFGIAVMIVEESGRIIFKNQGAEGLLCSAKTLRVKASNLVVMPSYEGGLLKILAGRGGNMLIEGPDGDRLYLTAVPLPRQPGEFRQRVLNLLLITDFRGKTKKTKAIYRELFGLTRAEADLASALIEGGSLRETAEQLQISYHTARTQLKQVFAKTGCRRQADLVRVLLHLG